MKKSKLLLLTNALDINPRGGRELLCKHNYEALRSIYGDLLVLYELPTARSRRAQTCLNALRGHIDGLSAETVDAALAIIERQGIRKVFVDGSNLGAFVAALKLRMPSVEVITFFHNVEAYFFWGALRGRRTLRALAVLVVNYIAENMAVRWSDKRVCLSERDSRQLRKLYGKGATHIAPMALEDRLPKQFADCTRISPESFALFVGSDFYANRDGIAWFVREVAPRISKPIYIVGRGFEKLRVELEIPGKVKVIGAVDSLADWYRQAQFVIAPIFDGSGMKTKVAEALMFGKKVIGTPEAFSGYEDFSNQAGWVCRTADEFVAAICTAQNEITSLFDHNLREIYESNFSYDASRFVLHKLIEA